jgi:outer membrane protein TolC
MDPVQLVILTVIMKGIPLVLVGGAIYAVYRSPLGRALAQRVRDGAVTTADVAALVDDLEQVRHELAEVQERLDFAERALAQGRPPLPRIQPVDDRSPTPPEPVLSGR